MLIISRSIIGFSRRDRWSRGALSAPYVHSQTTVTAVFYYYTAHIRRTASLHVIRLAQAGFVPPHMKGALVPLFHTCANFSKRCEWFPRASYQENNLQTPRIRPRCDESSGDTTCQQSANIMCGFKRVNTSLNQTCSGCRKPRI